MKKTTLLLLFAFSIVSNINAQKMIGGVALPNTIQGKTTDNVRLVLNGGGIREKLWLDMYIGGLYLKTKSKDPDKITKADETMAIKLHIVSGLITSSKMISAINEGFEKSTKNNTTPLKAKITKFTGAFRETIDKQDIFDIIYLPGKGVGVYKNGKLKATIEGLKFKQALWGIWLCDEPADEDLKEGMLGLE